MIPKNINNLYADQESVYSYTNVKKKIKKKEKSTITPTIKSNYQINSFFISVENLFNS